MKGGGEERKQWERGRRRDCEDLFACLLAASAASADYREGRRKGEEGCFITEFPQRLSFHIAVMEPSYTVLPRGGEARASNIFIPEERGGREYAIRVRVLRGE